MEAAARAATDTHVGTLELSAAHERLVALASWCVLRGAALAAGGAGPEGPAGGAATATAAAAAAAAAARAGVELIGYGVRLCDGPQGALPGLAALAELRAWARWSLSRAHLAVGDAPRAALEARAVAGARSGDARRDELLAVSGELALAAALSAQSRHNTAAAALESAAARCAALCAAPAVGRPRGRAAPPAGGQSKPNQIQTVPAHHCQRDARRVHALGLSHLAAVCQVTLPVFAARRCLLPVVVCCPYFSSGASLLTPP